MATVTESPSCKYVLVIHWHARAWPPMTIAVMQNHLTSTACEKTAHLTLVDLELAHRNAPNKLTQA